MYFRGVARKINKVWLLMSLYVSLWSLGLGLMVSAPTEKIALFYLKYVHYFGAIFIPAAYLHFTLLLIGKDNEKKKIIFASYVIASGFLISNFLGLFATVKAKDPFNYYTDPLPLYFLYTFVFMLSVGYSLFLMLKAYRGASDIGRQQIKYQALATIVGFGGGSSAFFYVFNIPILPAGMYFMVSYNLIMSYAIIRYRLMDIGVAVTRAGIFTIVYMVVLGIPFGIGFKILGKGLWILPVSIMAVFATAGPFIYNHFRRKAEKRLLAEEHRARELLTQAAQGMMRIHSFKELKNLIVHITCLTLKLDNAALFLVDEPSGKYKLESVRLKSKYKYLESIDNQDPLVQRLSNLEEPLVYEEVKMELEGLMNKNNNSVPEIVSQMKKLSAQVIVPASLKGKLFAFLILGEKRTKRLYSQDDLKTLYVLSYQTALAIENALLYERENNWLIEKSRRQALADMSTGVSHQFNNRLVSISSAAENLLDLIQNDSQGLSKEALIELCSKDLKLISYEAIKGEEIARAILQKSKAKLEYTQVDMIQLIKNAITLTKLRRTKETLDNLIEPEIIFNRPEELPLITLSEAVIQDSIENIFNNAIDAYVTKSKRLGSYQGKITITLSTKGKYVIIQIEDNGIGIQKENLPKLFVPYFTTKATAEKGVSGGTGLGLWVIRDFIEKHNGTISIESEYQEWTRFIINLPMDFKPK